MGCDLGGRTSQPQEFWMPLCIPKKKQQKTWKLLKLFLLKSPIFERFFFVFFIDLMDGKQQKYEKNKDGKTGIFINFLWKWAKCAVARVWCVTSQKMDACRHIARVRARTHLRSPPFQNLPLWFMSFSSHFHFFVLVDKSYKKWKYYVIVCLLFYYFSSSSCLSCLAKGKHGTENHATFFRLW